MVKKHFLFDLARGGQAEELVCKFLIAAGFPSHVDKTAGSKWDIKSEYGRTYITTEVKYDEYEHHSGNIAIEVYNPHLGQPSGITVTKAFFWVHVLKHEMIWITPVSKLKKYLDNTAPGRVIDVGGDKNATLWLYPSQKILPKVFTHVNTMTTGDLQLFITKHWEKAQ